MDGADIADVAGDAMAVFVFEDKPSTVGEMELGLHGGEVKVWVITPRGV